MANLSHEEQLKIISELEIEMMADMFTRMSNACKTKCVPPKYKESDLSKGEGVCLDRCVAKYMEIHERVGKKLSSATMQNQEAAQKLQGANVQK